jgi:hypothetical protein
MRISNCQSMIVYFCSTKMLWNSEMRQGNCISENRILHGKGARIVTYVSFFYHLTMAAYLAYFRSFTILYFVSTKSIRLSEIFPSSVHVGPIWVQPIQIYSYSRYVCRYRSICTSISATDTDTDIFILADILPISGILADMLIFWPISTWHL